MTLQAQLNAISSGGVPTSSTLADVLLNGNSAGVTDIDMNNNDILNCNNLQAVTINGNPIVGAQNINQVLATGNTSLDKSQIFTATASTISTNIDDAEVNIINSSGGVNTLLEYDKLTIDDNAGSINILDSGGEVITSSNATFQYNTTVISTGIGTSQTNIATSALEFGSIDFIDGVAYTNNDFSVSGNDTKLSMKANPADGTIRCFNSGTPSALAPIEIQASVLTLSSEVAFTNVLAPTCPAPPLIANDLCNKQYVDSQSALTAYQLYFNYSIPYTVPSGATYQTLGSTQVNTPTTVAWTTNSTAPVFLGGFFNLLSTLNITSIPAGVWTLLAFANLNSISFQGRVGFFYTIIGTASTGAETILYTSPASLLLNTVTPLVGSVSIQGTIPLISLTGYTGLGIKLYIQSNVATLTTGSVLYQTPNAYSSILTSVLPISAISTLSQVLVAGNTAVNTITLQDATNPATLFSQMSDTGFIATDGTGIPQYDVSVSASNIAISNTNGDSNTLTTGTSTLASATYQTILSGSGLNIDDLTSITDYSRTGIDAGNQVGSIDYQVSSNMSSSADGYGRLDLTSGDLTTTPPRAILQAFVDFNASPSYAPNINLIDLGGANGEELLISNGNSDNSLGLAYNTIQLFSDSTVNNSFIQLQTIDASTSAGSTLFLGQSSFSLSTTNQTALSIASGFTDPIVVRRNISTTTTTGLGQPVGLLENSVTNATTTGTTTLTIADAFATIINSPTAPARIFVLPAPTAGTAGYWYAVCNRATANTIAVQQPLGTTIATIPISPALGNGGSVVKFAVNSTGATYFRVN